VVRLAQFSTFLSPERRLSIAKNIAAAKIHNQLRLVKKYKYHDTNPEFDSDIAAIETFSGKMSNASTIDEVMGLEGVSAKYYWDCFKRLLINPIFTRRDYRPAPDYVNALLNLGYAFLANEITVCLIAEHFDIEIGFLHSVHYGRASLALDVIEEFRSPFIDAWLLGLLNRKILKTEHFTIENGDFRLTPCAFSKFCRLYHTHVDGWRERFRQQAKQLRTSVMEGNIYEPYRE
jgi:CRISPR-associated protein Cas1